MRRGFKIAGLLFFFSKRSRPTKSCVGGRDKMKCIVCDYVNGEVVIINMDVTQCHEAEEILTDNYEYSLENIEWILVNDDKIRWATEA
jgi:hypothetical protein